MTKENRQLVFAMLGGLLAVIGFSILVSVAPDLVRPPERPTPTPGGIPVGQYRDIHDFALTDQNGAPFKLSNLKGRPLLLSFGYTFCPDVCPLTLADFKATKKLLDAQGVDAAYVFVSIDPERDSAPVLKRYVALFDPGFIGLTGPVDQVQAVASMFDASFEKQPPKRGETAYLMAHSSFMYLIDGDGNWTLQYPFQTPPAVMAADIAKLTGK